MGRLRNIESFFHRSHSIYSRMVVSSYTIGQWRHRLDEDGNRICFDDTFTSARCCGSAPALFQEDTGQWYSLVALRTAKALLHCISVCLKSCPMSLEFACMYVCMYVCMYAIHARAYMCIYINRYAHVHTHSQRERERESERVRERARARGSRKRERERFRGGSQDVSAASDFKTYKPLYVCVYIATYTYIHIHIQIHVHVHVHVHIYIYICIL